jgi:hypothetical protein
MNDYPKTVRVADLLYNITLREGAKLFRDESKEVARLLHAGGAVNGTAEQIECRVKKAHVLVVARQGKDLIGVAALKVPQQSYRVRLRQETGVDLSADLYPVELGYVGVSKACRGHRLSSILMAELMSLPAGNEGVFATTKRDGYYKAALPDLGFNYRGQYQNSKEETVHLLTKPAI